MRLVILVPWRWRPDRRRKTLWLDREVERAYVAVPRQGEEVNLLEGERELWGVVRRVFHDNDGTVGIEVDPIFERKHGRSALDSLLAAGYDPDESQREEVMEPQPGGAWPSSAWRSLFED